MSRYITLEQYNNCSEEFKKEYQAWWMNNCQIGDKFSLCDEDKHDLSEFHCITSELKLDVTKRNYDNVRVGIPCIETLIDFIMDTGNGEIVLGDEGYYYYINTVKGNSIISKKIPIYPKDLKESLLRLAQSICKGVE